MTFGTTRSTCSGSDRRKTSIWPSSPRVLLRDADGAEFVELLDFGGESQARGLLGLLPGHIAVKDLLDAVCEPYGQGVAVDRGHRTIAEHRV